MRHWPLHHHLVLLRASNARRVSSCLLLFLAILLGNESLAYAQGLIATSSTHTCALTKASDAGVKCWGSNSSGQLGDGSIIPRNQPVSVVGLSSGVKSVGVGDAFSCALLMNGQVRCWGTNGYGQLGNNSSLPSSVPVTVLDDFLSGPLTDVTQLSVGGAHVCVVHSDGGGKCWGLNDRGQLGDDSTNDRRYPGYIFGFTNGVLTLDGGQEHACLISNPLLEIFCFGSNTYGQLGDGTGLDSMRPSVISGYTAIAGISAGVGHTCARRTDGTVICWGRNTFGQCGDESTTDRMTPVDVLLSGFEVTHLSAGASHTCAIHEIDSEVFCWGRGLEGQIGDGTANQRLSPTSTNPQLKGALDISSQGNHSCAWMAECSVACWGSNSDGQIGNGTFDDARSPVILSICSAGDPTPTPTPTATPIPPEACASERSCIPDSRLTTPLDPAPPLLVSVTASTSQKPVKVALGPVRLGIPVTKPLQNLLRTRLSKFLKYKVTNLAAAVKSLQVHYVVTMSRATRAASADLEAMGLPTKYKTETRSRRISTRLGPGTYTVRVNVRLKDAKGRIFSTGKRSTQTTFTVR